METGCADATRNIEPVLTPRVGQLRGPLHARAAGALRRYAAQLESLRRALAHHDEREPPSSFVGG